MATKRDEVARVKAVYRRRARRYDVTSWLQVFMGFRNRRYHRLAIRLLAPRPGETVLEIGCGTGLNFAALRRAVGSAGIVVGVDASPEMLEQARQRVARHGWTNVTLIEADATTFEFPTGLDRVLATFSLLFMPGSGGVVERAIAALRPGGRFCAAELEVPAVLAPLVLLGAAPYGHTRKTLARRPRKAAVGLEVIGKRRFFFGLGVMFGGDKPL